MMIIFAGVVVLISSGAGLLLVIYDKIKEVAKQSEETYWMLYDHTHKEQIVKFPFISDGGTAGMEEYTKSEIYEI